MVVVTTAVVVVLGIVAIRITITFDINIWLQDRRVAKPRNEDLRRANRCADAWTISHASTYSRCNLCLAYIPTKSLLLLESAVAIAGIDRVNRLLPQAGEVVVSDPAEKSP